MRLLLFTAFIFLSFAPLLRAQPPCQTVYERVIVLNSAEESFGAEAAQLRDCALQHQNDTMLLDYYHLIFGYYHQRQEMDSLSLLLPSFRQLAARLGDARRLMRAELAQGVYLEKLQRFPEALRQYEHTLRLSEVFDQKRIRPYLLKNIAGIYLATYQTEEAIPYYMRAVNAARLAENYFLAAQAAQDLAFLYAKNDQYEAANAYLDSASTDYKKENSPAYRLLAVSKNYNDARLQRPSRPDTLAALLAQAAPITPPFSMIMAYSTTAKIWLERQRIDSARFYADTAFALAKEYELDTRRYEIYEILSQVAAAEGNYNSAYQQLKIYQHNQELHTSDELQARLAHIKSTYELDRKERQIALLDQAQALQRLWIVLLCAAALALLSALLLLWRLARRKSENQQLQLENQKLQLLKQEQENKNLALQLDQRNRELTTTALQIIKKGELLEDVRNSLRPLIKSVGENIDQAKEQLQQVQEQLRSEKLFDSDWEIFRQHFNNVHPDFLDRLQRAFPQLTLNDLRHCAYIRMNLARREIAMMMNVNIEAVKMARNRLKKKVNLETEESLIQFLLDYR